MISPVELKVKPIDKSEVFKEVYCDGEYYPNYYISNYGRLYSKITNRIVNGSYHSGYIRYTLKNGDACRNLYSHRIVATAFISNENPEEWDCINHRDEQRDNNHFSNLEWCSRKMNNNWKGAPSRNAAARGLVTEMFNEFGVLLATFVSMNEAARLLGFSLTRIGEACKSGKAYKTYYWRNNADKEATA